MVLKTKIPPPDYKQDVVPRLDREQDVVPRLDREQDVVPRLDRGIQNTQTLSHWIPHIKRGTTTNQTKSYLSLFLQLTRFGIVGVTAAAVHFTIVVLLVESGWLQPLVANIAAFCIAFQVSYWGHRTWTFGGTQKRHAVAFPRLLLVSTLAFTANESLFFLLMKQFALPYPVALVVVLSILPLLVFTVNKLWVFE